MQDIDRPDVGGVAPKMHEIAEIVRARFKGITPFLRVQCDDNIMSSVQIFGSFDAPDTWANGIYHNGLHFRFTLTPAKGARYYSGGTEAPVTVELALSNYRLREYKFRKSTTTPAKALDRISKWIRDTAREVNKG